MIIWMLCFYRISKLRKWLMPYINIFSFSFLQKYWHIVDICYICYSESLKLGPHSQQWKLHTHWSNSKAQLSNKNHWFCPTSICNVICKLVSKVLDNRLVQILPSIINYTQRGFVHGGWLQIMFMYLLRLCTWRSLILY